MGIPDIHYFPISALKGENVVEDSDKMSWYKGRSILNFLEEVHVSSDRNFEDMRYPVQYVNRPDINFRGFAATVASGIVRKGAEVMSLPSGQKSTIKDIVTYDGNLDEAFPPQSVTITLEDEIDASRGDMIVYPDNLPMISQQIDAMLVWMDENTMDRQMQFFVKHANNSTRGLIKSIDYKVDVNTLEHSKIDAFELNDIGRVQLTTAKPLFFDPYEKNHITGSFILIDPITHNTAAVGMIIGKSKDANNKIITSTGIEFFVKDDKQATDKYNECKLKGRTVVRLDSKNVKDYFKEEVSETVIESFAKMLLTEGIDVII